MPSSALLAVHLVGHLEQHRVRVAHGHPVPGPAQHLQVGGMSPNATSRPRHPQLEATSASPLALFTRGGEISTSPRGCENVRSATSPITGASAASIASLLSCGQRTSIFTAGRDSSRAVARWVGLGQRAGSPVSATNWLAASSKAPRADLDPFHPEPAAGQRRVASSDSSASAAGSSARIQSTSSATAS